MGFPQALSETRAIQAEVPTKLVGNLSHSLCWKAFPQPLSEGYNIHNLVDRSIHYLNNKLEEMEENEETAGKEAVGRPCRKICKYDRTGFCRERENCHYFHGLKVCEEFLVSSVRKKTARLPKTS